MGFKMIGVNLHGLPLSAGFGCNSQWSRGIVSRNCLYMALRKIVTAGHGRMRTLTSWIRPSSQSTKIVAASSLKPPTLPFQSKNVFGIPNFERVFNWPPHVLGMADDVQYVARPRSRRRADFQFACKRRS
jgi:hypothetical protein